jgi:poly-beta-1,6-N-acetyl-D-glucosamine biosynthesis protein PgaD
MRVADVLIEHPERVSRARRGFLEIVTVAAWAAFVWLFQPLVTLVVWALGGWVSYQEVVRQAKTVEPAVVLAIAILAAASATALVGWAEYNRQRFEGKKRRVSSRIFGSDDGAIDPEMSGEMRGTLRLARVSTVHFSSDGLPDAVESRSAG